jgi:hypothetical protein
MVVGCAVIFAMLMPDINFICYPFRVRFKMNKLNVVVMCLLCLGSFAYG